ncbi:hypothetical protein [Thioclava kandeliae]|uniref:TnsA endonuclease N-terminal domain-containing protein n=1 Tax=Thioclava kandeliae TaxID=3070818 RepID=A0ABV1SNF1_9RHOB
MFAARSKSSARGFLLAKLHRSAAWRKFIFESNEERKCLLVSFSQREVVDIWDQLPRVPFRDAAGKLRYHVFDYLLLFETGFKLALAVKPSALVERNCFEKELALIKAQLPKRFADDALLVTENSYSEAEVRNAELLHMFRGIEDAEADAAVVEVLRGLNGSTSVQQVVKATGLKGRAYRAVFRAIFDGAVEADLSQHITERSILMLPEVR